MQQKLLRNVVLFGIVLVTFGIIISGCINEPTIPPIQPMMTSLRFVNAVTDSSAIDVYINSKKMVPGLAFKQASKYQNDSSGDWMLFVTVAGSITDTLFSQKITLASLTQQTIVIYDKAVKNPGYKYTPAPILQTIERYTYSDEAKALADSNSTTVKLINVITGTAPVKIMLDAPTGVIVISGPLDDNGKPTSDGIAFGKPSPYSFYSPSTPAGKLSPGTYNFYFMATTGLEVIPLVNAKVEKGVRYTFVLLGTSASADYLMLTDDK